MRNFYLTTALMLLVLPLLRAQDDLLALLGDEIAVPEYITAAFKTNRVINLHSLENTPANVMDLKISHRFGTLNQGIYELFGLDNATIRIGLDYGISDRLTVGAGRSSFQKTYDGFVKYTFIRQQRGQKKRTPDCRSVGHYRHTDPKMAGP